MATKATTAKTAEKKVEAKAVETRATVKKVKEIAKEVSDNGALAKALVDGMSLEESIRLANAVGALTVTRHGAVPSLPTKEEVERFIQSRTRF